MTSLYLCTSPACTYASSTLLLTSTSAPVDRYRVPKLDPATAIRRCAADLGYPPSRTDYVRWAVGLTFVGVWQTDPPERDPAGPVDATLRGSYLANGPPVEVQTS